MNAAKPTTTNQPAAGKSAPATSQTQQPNTAANGAASTPEETKAQKFKRLGAQRMTKARTAVRLVGQVFSSNYEWTPEQASKVITDLKSWVAEVEKKSSVKPQDAPAEEGYSL